MNAMPKAPLVAADPLAGVKQGLDENGFCIIPDVLPPETVAVLRQRVLDQAQAERALGLTTDNLAEGPNERVFMLVNKGPCLVDLVTHPLALELAGHLLGGQFLLMSFTANIARFGGVEQALHCDDWWTPRPIRPDQPFTRVGDFQRTAERPGAAVTRGEYVSPPCVINFAWMLTDFTIENGGTRLAPRSHLSGRNPDGSVPHRVETIAAQGKAGSVVVFDGRTWHGTGRNLTAEPRIAALLAFCGPQFRSQENYFLGLDPRVYETSSDKFKELLGFKTWNGYGRTEARFATGFVKPNQGSYPELTLKR